MNDPRPIPASADLDVGFLKQGLQIVAGLDEASAELKRHEAEARRKEEARFDAHLRDYVTNPRSYSFGGLVNAVDSIVKIVDDLAGEATADSEAEADYIFASKVLRAASAAVDLCYGERSNKSDRVAALDQLEEAIAKVRT